MLQIITGSRRWTLALNSRRLCSSNSQMKLRTDKVDFQTIIIATSPSTMLCGKL